MFSHITLTKVHPLRSYMKLQRFHYLTLGLFILLNIVSAPLFSQYGINLFNDSVIHEIKIFSEQNSLATLTKLYEDNRKLRFKMDPNQYANCQVTIDGISLAEVGVRYKGASSYSATSSIKKSLKLDFNEFVKGQKYQGLKKLNLHNGMGDPSFMRESLCYELLSQADAPYCKTAYAKVYLNNKYLGLYLMVEQIDKSYLKRHFGTSKGTLYKVISGQDLSTIDNKNFFKKFFQLRTNKDTGNYDKLFEFVELINNNSGEQFREEIDDIFDVSSFLKSLAVYTLTNNWDSYLGTCRNYYLYHNPRNDKLIWIPWDQNLTFGGTLKDYLYDAYAGTCNVTSRFKTIRQKPLQYAFYNKSSANVQSYFWDFGDGQSSTEMEPSHAYDKEGAYEVCLTTQATYFGQDCESTRCQTLKTPSLLVSCPCFENDWTPYSTGDTTLQKAIVYYPEICDNKWSQNYQVIYDYFTLGDQDKPKLPKLRERDFSLLHKESNKILINRILSIPEYEEEYLLIIQQLLEEIFNPKELSQYIDKRMELIRESIINDPDYLYPQEIVELDLTEGKPADPHDPERIKLIGINNFIKKKYEQVHAALDQL